MYSVLDLVHGFWNIPIEAQLQSIFAFETAGVAYTWKRLPQGWLASPGLFQSRIASLFADLRNVIVYMDDIFVGTDQLREHWSLLESVFQRIAAAGLKINLKKSQICKSSVKYLGFEVFNGSFSLRKYAEIQSQYLPEVSSKRQLRKVIGIMNLCRSCCPQLDDILRPLTALLRQKQLPNLSDLQALIRKAWQRILLENLTLYFELPNEELYLECDWSQTGKGFVLFCGRPERGHIISISSKQHNEMHLSSYLGELKTIVWSLTETKTLTAGRKIKLYTVQNLVHFDCWLAHVRRIY